MKVEQAMANHTINESVWKRALISTSEEHRYTGEPANVVDGLYDIARSIRGADITGLDEVAKAIKEAGTDIGLAGMGDIADAIRYLADVLDRKLPDQK